MRDDDPAESRGEVLEGGRDVGRHPVRSALLAGVVVVAAAAWAFTTLDEDGGPAAAPSRTDAPSATSPAGSRNAAPPTSSADAGGTAGAFYAFASTGDPATMSHLWADWVTVSTPQRTWTMTRRQASHRDAWRSGAAGDGPRDLLRKLERSGGSFAVYLEDTECVGARQLRSVNPVGRVTSRILVAVRPLAGTPCARWWGVDLVFTPEDRISQVHVR